MPVQHPVTSAIVFAAGLGTRMRPISDTLPKPLVRVAGKALIDHVLDRCAEAGIETAVVNVHHLADQIEAHLRERDRPPRIVVSDERRLLLDQGGGIKQALPSLGSAFLVCNTDAFWVERDGPAMPAFMNAWDPDVMDVLLLVAETEGSVGVDWDGDFHLGSDGRLTRRRAGSAPFVYAGVGIMKAEAFATVPDRVFKLAPFFFQAATRGRLFGQRIHGRWMHVGTPGAIAEADRAAVEADRTIAEAGFGGATMSPSLA